MPWSATVYKVLIASPNDVQSERNAVTATLHAWSDVNGERQGIIFQPLRWESHAVPEMGDRPQAIINKQLVDKCDVLIGVFWSKLGTPTGVEESGTVEEVKECMAAGKQVKLYFSKRPIPQEHDSQQFEALRKFKEWCMSNGLVSEFESEADLREQIGRALSQMAEELGPRTEYEAAVDTVMAQSGESDEQEAQLKRFVARFSNFVRRFEAEWAAERDSEPYNIEDGKTIASSACSQLLDHRAQVVSGGPVVEVMESCAKRLKALQRVRLVADGGASFRGFWDSGNEVIAELKGLVNMLSGASVEE